MKQKDRVLVYYNHKDRKLKSKVQSFDLTDLPDYEGVHSILKYLEQQKDNKKLDIPLLMALMNMNSQTARLSRV